MLCGCVDGVIGFPLTGFAHDRFETDVIYTALLRCIKFLWRFGDTKT